MNPPPITPRLWLIRHAQPLIAPGICYGRSDIPDDPAATASAAATLALSLPPLRLFSSPLQRCVHLVQAVQALRPDVTYQTDPRLAEMDFGTWERQPWASIPQAEIDGWTAHFADTVVGGNGESVRHFMQRVAGALQDWRASGVDAAWFCHAGVARAAKLLLAGTPCPEQASDWPREGLGMGAFEVVCA